MTRAGIAFSLVALIALASPAIAANEQCAAADFARAVDGSGARIREFSIKIQPTIRERLRRYAEAKQMPEPGSEDAALDAIQDEKLAGLDEKSADLLLRVDNLGRVAEGEQPDCSKLDDIKSSTTQLLAVMQEKSDYMLVRLDSAIGKAGANAKPPEAVAKVSPPIAPKAPTPTPAKPEAAKEPNKPPAVRLPTPAWETDSKPSDAYVPPPVGETASPPAIASGEVDGYSIDEIREATRGFFGNVSTGLASVIEHAFKTSGRPTAYVLGTEGGGAFLAGLRYGKGTLYMRNLQLKRDVYWHGPSLGTDFGASGSRTMFLIYRMNDPQALYRSFTGVDGSAYFVGGVGVTLLKGGEVIMAPIRSGLGLRVGANVGYVRFTDRATWNPF